ncbi:MAG: hypothetical protein JW849_04325 [Phycisphaerae bacterium]|nr:hypothetical protein [Phycisphaerae bacterium]
MAEVVGQSEVLPYVPSKAPYDAEAFARTYEAAKAPLRKKRLLATFAEYGEFIHALRKLPRVRFVPMRELLSPGQDDHVRCALRFDVDMDPIAAVRLARFNARYGLCGSFYLLHTAMYYGVFDENGFVRNPRLREWVRALVLAGAEIGLHIDPLTVYFLHHRDGLESVRTELNWLRTGGVSVNGVAAHNSYPLFGAENFEIFREYTTAERSALTVNGVSCPLGSVPLADWELTYEANYPKPPGRKIITGWFRKKPQRWMTKQVSDAVNNRAWMRTYLLDNPVYDRAYTVRVWYHGPGRWTLANAGRFVSRSWLWQVDLATMLEAVQAARPASTVVFHLHPVYFAADTDVSYEL